MSDKTAVDVTHDSSRKRFEVSLEGEMAFVAYHMDGHDMVFTHTEVPEKFEGRGIGSQLAKVALDYARDHEYGVQPVCPFIADYIQHQEYQPLTEK